MIYVIAGLVILSLVFLAMFLFEHSKTKSLNSKYKQLQEYYNGLKEEFELYRKAEQFKHQKEEEANEKINNLHNGTLSADDILPKR